MRAIGGRRRCSAREHCTGAPIPNATRQAVLSNRTQISPPSDSDGGEIKSGLLRGPRPTVYKAIASIARSIALRSPYYLQGNRPDRPPIALGSPYDLQGNRPDRPPIAPSVEEGDRSKLLGTAPIAQLHPVRPLKF